MKLSKIILFLIIFFSLFLGFYRMVQAQEPALSSLEKFQKNLKKCSETGEVSMECWIGGPEQVAEEPDKASTGVMPVVANSLTTMIIGPIPSIVGEGYRPGGAIGGITNLIAAMYANPPASSVEYFADLGRNLGIVKPAYAQGVGFEGLRPILPLWKAFRNIAYLFFTIIFVVIGFAIMFRVKLDPQTVISIQNAIPRIVVALILVTFSYAIAGLLIDLIYVIISLGILILGFGFGSNIITPEKILEEQKTFTNLSFSHAWGILTWRGIETYWSDVFPGLFESTIQMGWLATLIGVIFSAIGGTVGGIILILLFGIVTLFVMIKLFLSLIKCYISILLSVIFGPLQIMFGVLPGNQMGFGSWLRNIFANAMVFPAVAIFIFFSWYLGKLISHVIPETAIWTPPGLSGSSQLTIGLISLGMLLVVHKIPDMVKEALQVKPFPYGAAIGEALGPARAGWGIAWPVGRQAAYEKWLAGYPSRTVRGVIGRAGELIGLWKKP